MQLGKRPLGGLGFTGNPDRKWRESSVRRLGWTLVLSLTSKATAASKWAKPCHIQKSLGNSRVEGQSKVEVSLKDKAAGNECYGGRRELMLTA